MRTVVDKDDFRIRVGLGKDAFKTRFYESQVCIVHCQYDGKYRPGRIEIEVMNMKLIVH
jgi:hypothetical protein